MLELSEQAQRYVKLAVTKFDCVNEADVYKIVTALQRHNGPLYMAHVAEAVAYGNLARLRAIAGKRPREPGHLRTSSAGACLGRGDGT